jgi:hypothetical protein
LRRNPDIVGYSLSQLLATPNLPNGTSDQVIVVSFASQERANEVLSDPKHQFALFVLTAFPFALTTLPFSVVVA